MAVELYMPKNGMDMTEGTIVRWLKEEGDPVEKGEPVMEIETDKVTMEAESPASGVLLKKLFQNGDVVPVLTTLGYIGSRGESLPELPAPERKASGGESPETPSQNAAEYQVAVVGGGPAGYVAAIRAAQLGARVVLFERDRLGGTCLNRGCVPTKTLLKTAEYLRYIKEASDRGIRLNGGIVQVDMPSAVENKDKVVKTLTDGVEALLRTNHVTVVRGEARLRTARRIACGGREYTAERIILCGGSKPVRPPIPGIESRHVLTSTEILELKELPTRLCIIGGGVIGCEFASIFQAFGVQVTIVEKMDRLMETMDADVSRELEKCMKRDWVVVHLCEGVKEILEHPDGLTVVTDHLRVECDKVLLSIGRVSDLDCLGDMAGEIRTENGKVAVDETMRTSVEGIYACGDINGRAMLAHAAFRMGEVAAENCVRDRQARCPLKYVPSVLYTSPEAACVGLTEEQARGLYPDGVQIGKFPMSANSRAVASGERDGFVKVIVERAYGELLGVHIIGGLASEMIAEAAALMSAEVTAQEIASRLIHPHPSYSEAFSEACSDALGGCIHLPPKRR